MRSQVLKGKPILITGASRGIGQATAVLLSRLGASVILAGRDPDALSETARHCDGVVNSLSYDVADEKDVKEQFLEIQKLGLFGLVNCAGIMMDSAIAFTRLSDLDAQYQVNVRASYQHAQLAARLMSRQGEGVIINLASVIGEEGSPGQSAYSATKAAIAGLTKSLAKELGGMGVRVNAVAPGFIDTPMTAHYDDEKRQEIIADISLQRLGKAEEVAELIAFLMSDKASYITGQVIGIDGGMRI